MDIHLTGITQTGITLMAIIRTGITQTGIFLMDTCRMAITASMAVTIRSGGCSANASRSTIIAVAVAAAD